MEITPPIPWFQRVRRWGQTNLTESDARDYDFDFWRNYWRETKIGGVIVNAGGIVAYYPSRFALHNRAQFLGERDLFGEITALAREENLAVLARMDSNRASQAFFETHPDWFCRDQSGAPIVAGGRYVSCVNGPYYREWIPQILAEIIERSAPDGFADNSWSGLGRGTICYCQNCRDWAELPEKADWDDPIYRAWIEKNYARRLEIWDEFNTLTKRLGGAHCLWLGMVCADPLDNCGTFRSMREIAQRTPFLLLDAQWRTANGPFARNATAGKRWHELGGWDWPIAESMAQYQGNSPTFRRTAQNAPEARLWMQSGFAGNLRPWWHHVGAAQGDKRQFQTPPAVFSWHAQHEDLLKNREPIADVAVLWSQRNLDLHGREQARERVLAPNTGVCDALMRARIPFLPLHVEDLATQLARFRVLVLPEIGVLSAENCKTVRDWVEQGGGLVASGEVARREENGDWQGEFGLADVLGIAATAQNEGILSGADVGWEAAQRHSYLQIKAPSHLVFDGLEDTDILPFGGVLTGAKPNGAQVLATYLPPFPIYPPETAWFQSPPNSLPAVFAHGFGAGRSIYFAADIDRSYARDALPDHAKLLANAVRFAAQSAMPLEVSGAGLLDCHLFRQENRLILHLVNEQNAAPSPLHELVAVGPLEIKVRRDILPEIELSQARFLVGETCHRIREDSDWWKFSVEKILDHEVVVLEATP